PLRLVDDMQQRHAGREAPAVLRRRARAGAAGRPPVPRLLAEVTATPHCKPMHCKPMARCLMGTSVAAFLTHCRACDDAMIHHTSTREVAPYRARQVKTFQ